MDYIAYYRVSTKRQGQSGLGLDAQKTSVYNFIKNNHLQSEYTEVESGTKSNRIELQKALLEAKNTGATLVIARLDRLSRNASFTFSLMDSGVKFVAVDMPEANELTIGIMSLLAQEEAKKISRNTKKALQELKAKGIKLGSPKNLTDLGRKNSIASRKEKAINNLNNRKAYAVIKVMAPNSNSHRMATYLNDNGFKTSGGSNFSAVQVDRVVKLYCG